MLWGVADWQHGLYQSRETCWEARALLGPLGEGRCGGPSAPSGSLGRAGSPPEGRVEGPENMDYLEVPQP